MQAILFSFLSKSVYVYLIQVCEIKDKVGDSD